MSLLLLLASLGCTPRTPEAVAPPPAPAAVTRTYHLKATPHVRAPERLDELMDQYFDVQLLLRATYAPGGALRLDVASVSEAGDSQDRCAPTTTLDALPLGADSTFQVEGGALGFVTEGVVTSYVGLAISGGVLGEDALTATSISGVVDTAPMGSLMGATDPAAVCSLVGKVLPCEPCPDGSGETCWTVRLEEVRAPVTELPVEVRTPEAVCADPACAEAPACRPG